MFHAVRALLALKGMDFKKHSSVIAHFREHYIKSGVLPVELSDSIGSAFNVRGNADYADFFIISKEEVKQQLERALRFVDEIEKFIISKI